ncbi:hypothetical protein TYRP_016453 [Tyrophagus putrescentiae]|nr:hypothetical protein TYRP_016453 [Tyrophagus putrescentiae]
MDAIDFDLLVENLTIYNESGTPFSRNRNFLDFLELSTSDNLEMWMTLGGVVLFTAIFSALIIFGTIFSNESILRR